MRHQHQVVLAIAGDIRDQAHVGFKLLGLAAREHLGFKHFKGRAIAQLSRLTECQNLRHLFSRIKRGDIHKSVAIQITNHKFMLYAPRFIAFPSGHLLQTPPITLQSNHRETGVANRKNHVIVVTAKAAGKNLVELKTRNFDAVALFPHGLVVLVFIFREHNKPSIFSVARHNLVPHDGDASEFGIGGIGIDLRHNLPTRTGARRWRSVVGQRAHIIAIGHQQFALAIAKQI